MTRRFKLGIAVGLEDGTEDGCRDDIKDGPSLLVSSLASTEGPKTASKMAAVAVTLMTRVLVFNNNT
jgi:hypothetical protein